MAEMAGLIDVPEEVLESVYKLTDSNTSVALMLTSKGFLRKLDSSKLFWKHVATSSNLGAEEWNEPNFEDTVKSWKCLYLKFKQVQARLVSHPELVKTSRIYLDLQRLSSWHEDGIFRNDLCLMVENDESQQKEVEKTFKHCSEGSIEQHIFGSSLSDKFMVVFVREMGLVDYHNYLNPTKFFVWNVEDNISFFQTIETGFICEHSVICEEVLVWEHFLILMNTNSEMNTQKANGDQILISVFDLRRPETTTVEDCAALFYVKGSIFCVHSDVEKEGGGQKLLASNNKLLVISPESHDEKFRANRFRSYVVTFYVLDLYPLLSLEVNSSPIILEQLWGNSLKNVVVRCPFSFIAIDQKGPAFVMSFSQEMSNGDFGQQFVYLNLDAEGEVLFNVFEGRSIEKALSDQVKIPILGTLENSEYVLDPKISDLRMECLIATSDQLSKFAILTTNGTIVTYQPSKGFASFRPITQDYADIDTYQDELHIYHHKIIVMKIFQNKGEEKKKLTYLTTFNGELLWIADHSAVLNPDQRLFLSPMFSCIFVSSADEAAVYNLNTGLLITKIQYPTVKKHPEAIAPDPDYSPYAQSGYSVWDIRRVGDRIVVTFDIERANPVIADWIDILGI